MKHLDFSQSDENGWCVLQLNGSVDAATFADFERQLAQLVEDGNHKIKLDLKHLAFIDSTGLGLLLTTYRQLRQRGGRLIAQNFGARTGNVFNVWFFTFDG